jgi:ribosomal protein S8
MGKYSKRGCKTMRKKTKKGSKTRKVRFNLKKNKLRTIPSMKKQSTKNNRRNKKRRTMRRYQKGGSLLPQSLTNVMRGSEHVVSNTINTLKGKPLEPSPYPTIDQPIDQSVEVV